LPIIHAMTGVEALVPSFQVLLVQGG